MFLFLAAHLETYLFRQKTKVPQRSTCVHSVFKVTTQHAGSNNCNQLQIDGRSPSVKSINTSRVMKSMHSQKHNESFSVKDDTCLKRSELMR